ncbi:conserved hypothetical protein [Frankia canadensis]|uniref:Uncharacterized protein n=1 Tax=Frankia canadensis TaxID=1836972 RepID=A0A2I2KUL9_9ACTN|nr:hypothetical protein [Frankia canadensis]SNQ49355.1 conserved hypothetical protein [Frankia canadensis]SOU56645.1 conserved hypothetical protein [Frankia canadensis]
MSAKLRGRKAWLVTWDAAGSHAAVAEREVVAAVLRPQTGPETVKRIVELLYMAREFDPADKLDALTRNPYPAKFGTVTVRETFKNGEVWEQRVTHTGQIICGHNPFLYARLVKNLRLKDSANPGSGLIWDEEPRQKVVNLDNRASD